MLGTDVARVTSTWLGLVLALAAGCSGARPGVPDGGVADAGDSVVVHEPTLALAPTVLCLADGTTAPVRCAPGETCCGGTCKAANECMPLMCKGLSDCGAGESCCLDVASQMVSGSTTRSACQATCGADQQRGCQKDTDCDGGYCSHYTGFPLGVCAGTAAIGCMTSAQCAGGQLCCAGFTMMGQATGVCRTSCEPTEKPACSPIASDCATGCCKPFYGPLSVCLDPCS